MKKAYLFIYIDWKTKKEHTFKVSSISENMAYSDFYRRCHERNHDPRIRCISQNPKNSHDDMSDEVALADAESFYNVQ